MVETCTATLVVDLWTCGPVDLVCLLTPRLLGTTGACLAPTLSPAPHPDGLQCDSGRPDLTQSTSQFTIASNMVKTGDILGHQHHHCKHCLDHGWWGKAILPWGESGYLHTSHHHQHYQYNSRVFCQSWKVEVIMCAELSRDGRRAEQEQNTQFERIFLLLLLLLSHYYYHYYKQIVIQTNNVCGNCLQMKFQTIS